MFVARHRQFHLGGGLPPTRSVAPNGAPAFIWRAVATNIPLLTELNLVRTTYSTIIEKRKSDKSEASAFASSFLCELCVFLFCLNAKQL